MSALTDRERSMIWREQPLSDGRTAVLLHYPDRGAEGSSDEINRNLVCLDEDGNLLWRVKPPKPRQPSGDSFVHLEFDGAVLKATRFFGDICEVDQSNGLATAIGWTK